jgi:hypothetical protein
VSSRRILRRTIVCPDHNVEFIEAPGRTKTDPIMRCPACVEESKARALAARDLFRRPRLRSKLFFGL